jgi:hypothetical protein
LSLLLDPTGIATPGTTIKKGRSRIEIGVVRHVEPLTTDDPDELLPHAIEEILSALQAVRERCHLPELPRLHLPEIAPETLHSFAIVHEDPIPPLPRELFKRLTRKDGLTPAAIESYYRHNPDAPGADYWLAVARRPTPP